MKDASIYWGEVLHAREKPVPHRFRYPHASFYCDVEEIAAVCKRSKLLSYEAWNCISFYRQDFLPSHRSLKEEVAHHILTHDGHVFAGRVCLLANWRSLGRVMNPIALFYCYEAGELRYVVIEVHNTPWDERHVYVVTCASVQESEASGALDPPNETQKSFHVSPFMPMDLQYHWQLPAPEQRCWVEIAVQQQEKVVFRAQLNLTAEALSAQSVKAYCLRYPIMASRVLFNIYWQALVLFAKRVPFFSHPNQGNITPR